MSVQSASKSPVWGFCLYCHLLSVAVPVTEAARVSLSLPSPPLALTPVGFGGRVGNAAAVATSVEQPLSL